MPEPITPAAPAATDQRDPKSVASNIVNNIHNKTNGAAPNGQQAPTPPPADPNAGKEKYKVDGREVWLTPEERTAWIQKGMAFEPKVTQLGHLQNELGAFMKTLASDPLKILTDKRIGMTPEIVLEKVLKSGQISDKLKESVGQWYYENVVAPMKMTPEELKAREDAKWRAERESQDKQSQEQALQRENLERVQSAMSQIKANIAEAMKESGLPSNDTPLGAEMARMVADVMRVAHFQRQSLTPKQAIEHVKSRIRSVQSAFYDHLDAETLVKELGEKNADKVKQYFLKLVKEAGKQIPENKAPSTHNKPGERKTMNQDEFHEYLDKIKRGA